MKANIHPEYGPASIRCACGNVIETRSTHQGTVQVEICSACHPFYTGKQKLMDTAGVIDRFKKKFGDKVVGTQKPVRKAPEPPAPKVKKADKSSAVAKLAEAKPAEVKAEEAPAVQAVPNSDEASAN